MKEGWPPYCKLGRPVVKLAKRFYNANWFYVTSRNTRD